MAMSRALLIRIGIMLTILAGLNAFLAWNVTTGLDAAGFSANAAAVWVVMYVLVFSYILGRVPLPKPLKPVGRLLKIVGSFYIFLFEMGILLFVVADLGALIVRLAGGDAGAYGEVAAWTIGGLMVLLLVAGTRNGLSPVVREYTLEIDKPGGVQREWSLVVASDIHLGNVIGNRHLRKLIAKAEELKPDLVLLPGDVIDDSIEPFLRNGMNKTISSLKAKRGVYAVLGNHEYYGGHIPEYAEKMKDAGIPVLQDETVLVADSLYIVGRKDKTAEAAGFGGGRKSVAELTEGLDHSKPIVLLDHQPTKFQQAADAGADLMLSGHTHRGQFAPNHWITKRLFELDWGYMRKDAMHVVVSSGFGLWGPPVRLASRSEILHIKLKFR